MSHGIQSKGRYTSTLMPNRDIIDLQFTIITERSMQLKKYRNCLHDFNYLVLTSYYRFKMYLPLKIHVLKYPAIQFTLN